MMSSYSDERREAVVAKLLPPLNLSVREVAQQEGISEPGVKRQFLAEENDQVGGALPRVSLERGFPHAKHFADDLVTGSGIDHLH